MVLYRAYLSLGLVEARGLRAHVWHAVSRLCFDRWFNQIKSGCCAITHQAALDDRSHGSAMVSCRFLTLTRLPGVTYEPLMLFKATRCRLLVAIFSSSGCGLGASPCRMLFPKISVGLLLIHAAYSSPHCQPSFRDAAIESTVAVCRVMCIVEILTQLSRTPLCISP